MQQRPSRLPQRRTRWTALEQSLLAIATLLMAVALGIESFHWLNPPAAPAAPRMQSSTATGAPTETATAEPTATAEATTVAAPTETTAEPTAETTTVAAPTEPTAAPVEPTDQPAEPSATPSQTVPTATLVPTWTPLPTFELTDPPLTVVVEVSSGAVGAGSQFSYFLTVGSSSDEPRQVELRYSVPSNLEIISASSSNGECAVGYPIVCNVVAMKSAAAQIIVRVQVPATLAPGSVLVSQALARDDQKVTASSERVEIIVAGNKPQIAESSPTVPTVPTVPSPAPPTREPVVPANGSPTGPPSAASPAPSATLEPSAASLTTVPTASSTVLPTSSAPLPASTAPAQGVATSVAQPAPGLPPTLAPLNPSVGQPANPATPSVSLPETSATLPAFGLGLGLFGLALTLHSTRRIRRADQRLSGANAAIAELGPLVDQSSELQQATAAEIARMQHDSAAMQALLKQIKPK